MTHARQVLSKLFIFRANHLPARAGAQRSSSLAGRGALQVLFPLLTALTTLTSTNAQARGDELGSRRSDMLLQRSEAAMTAINYAQAALLALRAIERGGLTPSELTRAYLNYALASAQLGDGRAAELAFRRLLALEPNVNLDRRLAPTRRNPLLQARGFWAMHPDAFRVNALLDRHSSQIVVRTRDALGWMKTVNVWSRLSAGPFVKRTHPAAPEIIFRLPSVGEEAFVEAYVQVLDEHGNVMISLGDSRLPLRFEPPQPQPPAPTAPRLAQPRSDSIAQHLHDSDRSVELHGYLSSNLHSQGVLTFELPQLGVLLRAPLLDVLTLDLSVQGDDMAHAGRDVYLPHAYADIRAHEYLTVRLGLFEAPIGTYNSYLYPDFLRTTASRALFADEVIPVVWSELGVQLRGFYPLTQQTRLMYAVFVSNGLEQPASHPNDGQEARGSLRDMRFNLRDQHHPNKALGGRLGVEHRQWAWGFSGYTGRYTVEDAHNLTILDADLSYVGPRWRVQAEAALTAQSGRSGRLYQLGGYALAALRLDDHFEPYAQYDYLELDVTHHRGLLGLAWWPFPGIDGGAAAHFRLKGEVGIEFIQDTPAAGLWLIQAAAAF